MASILSVLRTTSLEIREAGATNRVGNRFLRRLWQYVVRYTVGTGRLARDRGYQKQYTIAAGATQVIDLAGALTDDAGNIVTFPKVCEIRVLNHSTTLGLEIGPTSGGVGFGVGTWQKNADDRQIVGAGSGEDEPGEYFWSAPAGVSVTAATADKFDITVNAGGTGPAVVTVQIVGKSA